MMYLYYCCLVFLIFLCRKLFLTSREFGATWMKPSILIFFWGDKKKTSFKKSHFHCHWLVCQSDAVVTPPVILLQYFTRVQIASLVNGYKDWIQVCLLQNFSSNLWFYCNFLKINAIFNIISHFYFSLMMWHQNIGYRHKGNNFDGTWNDYISFSWGTILDFPDRQK